MRISGLIYSLVLIGYTSPGLLGQQPENPATPNEAHEPSGLLADLYEKRPAFKTAAEAIEYLRTKSGLSMEESMDIRLNNGQSVLEGKRFEDHAPLNTLRYLSKDVPASTLKDRLILMSYLKDRSVRVRCLAAMTLDGALKAFPGGMGVSDMSDVSSEGHQKMVELFASKIAEQETKQGEK